MLSCLMASASTASAVCLQDSGRVFNLSLPEFQAWLAPGPGVLYRRQSWRYEMLSLKSSTVRILATAAHNLFTHSLGRSWINCRYPKITKICSSPHRFLVEA